MSSASAEDSSVLSDGSSSEEKEALLKDSTQEYGTQGDSELESFPSRTNGVSNFGTIMHIINSNVSTGILAMPVAFSHAGILFGTVVLAMLAVLCVHCMQILVKSSHHLCRKTNRDHLDYADAAEAAVKFLPSSTPNLCKAAKYTVNTFLILIQFGYCCVYVLFIAKNAQLIVNQYIGNSLESSTQTYSMNIQQYEVIVAVFLIPLVFIRDMKVLAPFSMLANITSVVGLIIILYYILVAETLQPVSRLPLIKSWAEIPLYLSTAIYAFEGIGVLLPVENKMREPQAMPSMFGVLNVGMTVVCVLYITVGFYGYIEFGDNSQDSITLNLTSWYGTAVQVLFSICIYISYAIQFYVPLNILGPVIAASRPAEIIGPNLFDYIIRATLVLITVGIAAIVDEYLNLLIALVGSVASAALTLIFPAALEILTFWPERKSIRHFWITCSKDVCIFVFGIFCFLFGTVTAMQNLIQQLSTTVL